MDLVFAHDHECLDKGEGANGHDKHEPSDVYEHLDYDIDQGSHMINQTQEVKRLGINKEVPAHVYDSDGLMNEFFKRIYFI